MTKNSLPRYFFALHPDVAKPIGGVKQVHRLCEALTSLGRRASIVQTKSDFHPGWFVSNVHTIAFSELRDALSVEPNNNIIVLPETFMNVFYGYFPSIPKLIFNQNGAYSFGMSSQANFPSPRQVLECYRHSDVLHVLCVSSHDYHLLRNGFRLHHSKLNSLINPIETSIFLPSAKKRRQLAFMPRKNQRDSFIVTQLLRNQSWWKGWEIVPIVDMSQHQVANILAESVGFLSFGHPEGFGLPMAEALASGCYLIGYSGLGGRELFKIAQNHCVASEISFGDWQGFVDAVGDLNQLLVNAPEQLMYSLKQCSDDIRFIYSHDQFIESVSHAMSIWEARFFQENLVNP